MFYGLIPYQEMVLTVEAPIQEVVRRLRESLTLNPPIFLVSRIFMGSEVFETSFKLIPKIGYGNSFQPIFYGKLVDQGDWTLVQIRVSIRLPVLLLLGFMLPMIPLVSCFSVIMYIESGDYYVLMFPLIIFFVIPVVILIAFWAEVPRAKRCLSQALGIDLENNKKLK